MRRMGALAAAVGAVLALAAGCGSAPRLMAVSDVRVIGIADFTGQCPGDIKRDLTQRIPTMAVEVGLIGRAGDRPGKPILLRGEVTDFPPHGSSIAGTSWIEAGPMTVKWMVMREDGTQLGEATLTTDPRDAIQVPEDPFVYTQSRAVLLWLLGE